MLILPKAGRCAVYSLFVLLLASAMPVGAQTVRETSSLKFVPADVSFYSSALRNRETYGRFFQSRAFAKLNSLPIVQSGIQAAKSQFDANGDLVELRRALGNPQNLELLAMLREAIGDEVFAFGNERFAAWVAALNQFNNAMQMTRLDGLQLGEAASGISPAKMMELINKNPEILKVPSAVIGFKVGDGDRVERQIDRLEAWGQQQIQEQAPELKDRLKRESIGEASFLTLNLDGSLVPWTEVLKGDAIPADQKEQIISKLKEMELTVAVGLWNDYLLISLAETLAPLRSLGTGKLLVDRKEFAALDNARGKPVTGISYVSGDFLRRASSVDQQIDQMANAVKAVLPMVPIAEDVKVGVQTDVDRFAKEWKTRLPTLGSIMSYQYSTDDGFESFKYNWGEIKLDGSQPLSILNHIGGAPIGYTAFRQQPDVKGYDFSIKWFGTLMNYAERIAVPFLDAEQRDLFVKIQTAMTPLVKRLDKVNREKLMPAFADGQTAIVLDAILGDGWIASMPPADQPLPFPVVSYVAGLSDADSLETGAAEYFDVLQTAITDLATIMPEQVPPMQLTPPQQVDAGDATLYYYPLPPVAGMDKRIAPNAGVSDDLMVMSLLPEMSRRLLQSQTLERTGQLPTVERPLAAAFEFNLAALVDTARPWVEYGFSVSADQSVVDESVLDQVNVILDVIQCFHTTSGVSYFEDEVFVSHLKGSFKDLEE